MGDITPTYGDSLAEDTLRTMLATSATFQTLVGATGDTATKIAFAKTRIHITQAESAIISPTIVAGVVTAANIEFAGVGYTTAPTLTVVSRSGSGATITASVSSGAVSSLSVGAGGSGYVDAEVLCTPPTMPLAIIDTVSTKTKSIALGSYSRDYTLVAKILQSITAGTSARNATHDLGNTLSGIEQDLVGQVGTGGTLNIQSYERVTPTRGDEDEEAVLGAFYWAAITVTAVGL